jgi:hypothetical protein
MKIGNKEIVTLEQAVKVYLKSKIEETKIDLISFFNEMEGSYPDTFKVGNNRIAGIEFMVARCAIDFYSLWTLYPQQIANNIFTLTLKKYLKFDELSDKELAEKMFGYMDILEELKNSKNDLMKKRIIDRFSESFLTSILGPNIANFYLKGFQKKEIISPLLLAHCNNILFNYKVSWAALKSKIEIEM